MMRKGWYLVAYDIADNRRLGQVHRYLKKYGIAAQKSVFFVQGDEDRMNRLLDEIEERMDVEKDDLRAYPIAHPKKVWSSGANPLACFPILRFNAGEKKAVKNVIKAQAKRFFLRVKG